MLFLSSADFFQNQLFRKIPLELLSLDPDQARHFGRPELGPNCLQRLTADDTRRYRVNIRNSDSCKKNPCRTYVTD